MDTMSVPMKTILVASSLLLASFVSKASAQGMFPFGPQNYSHDFQVFAPVELDLDNLPSDGSNGYFLEYDKLNWSYSGERVTVGDPDVVAFAEEIFLQNPGDDGVRPMTFRIQNSLQDVAPDAGFMMGNRYEFGYRDQHAGWFINILDGPELNQRQVHGFGENLPGIDPDYTDGSDDPDSVGPVGEVRAFGFGSVPVLFKVPEGGLLGFRDYLNPAGAHSGTVGGPILYVGNYGNPIFAEPVDLDDGQVFRRADDLDGDGIGGSAAILGDLNMDGTIDDDEIIGFITDFDDLHLFNVYFDQVTIRNRTETDGVELMWSHRLRNRKRMAKRQNGHVEIFYGARFLKLDDTFNVEALGSILGRSFWDTSIMNQIVGPQIGGRLVNQRGRWTMRTDVRFMAGVNIQDWDQTGAVGEELIPGALNRPLYLRSTAFSYGKTEREFSPVGELRFETRYNLTQAMSLKLGYTATYIGNIRRAANSINYELGTQTMGFADNGTQDMFINGINFGVEFRH